MSLDWAVCVCVTCMVYDNARPLSEGLMTSLGVSTANSATVRATVADRKSSQKDNQRVPQLNNRKWLLLWSLIVLNLPRKHHITSKNIRSVCHAELMLHTVLKEVWLVVHFCVLCSLVVSVDGGQALDNRGRERNARGPTHVLQPLHLSNAPLENAKTHNGA